MSEACKVAQTFSNLEPFYPSLPSPGGIGVCQQE